MSTVHFDPIHSSVHTPILLMSLPRASSQVHVVFCSYYHKYTDICIINVSSYCFLIHVVHVRLKMSYRYTIEFFFPFFSFIKNTLFSEYILITVSPLYSSQFLPSYFSPSFSLTREQQTLKR